MLDFLKSIPSKLRHNVGIKLLSLGLAVVVWLLVVMYYNPETTDTFKNIPITINYSDSILEEQGLILVSEVDETVDVEIEDSREQLKAIIGKITAAVDISSVTKPGEYDLPVRILVDGQVVNAFNQSVKTVTLMFERAVKTQFTVEAITHGDVADGFVLEKVANPTVVTVAGPESVVSRITTVQAVVSQEKFTESGVFEGTLVYLDKDGKGLENTYLSTDTDTVKINVTLYEEKTVPLQLEVTNSAGGNDSSYLNIDIEPATITVTGTSEALEGINSISLGTLDVAEITAEYSKKFALILPNGVRNSDSIEEALVTFDFESMVTKQFTLSAVDVIIENTAKGTKIEKPNGNVNVTVRGDAADIDKLKSSDISLRIDCKNQALSKGSHRMSAYCVFPESYKVGAVGKYELTIKVS